jgi:hypothetical protein
VKTSLGGSGDSSVGGLMKSDKPVDKVDKPADKPADKADKPAAEPAKAAPAKDEHREAAPAAEPAKADAKPADDDKGVGSHAPKEAAGDPPVAAAAALTREVFDKVVVENQPSFKPCVDEVLRRNPKAKLGKVLISIKIAPSGKVTEASLDRKDAEKSGFGQCLLRASRRIVFPAFQGEPTPGVIPFIASGG